MMRNSEIIRDITEIFCTYLEKNKLRKTPERLAILQDIYSQDGHFNVDLLYRGLKKGIHNISRATVYNTVELLLDCGLITKHQFGKSVSQYERAYQKKQHDHLICEDCWNVFEFCDPRIHQIQKTAEGLANIRVSHHALNFYGRCKTLTDTGACEHLGNTKLP